MKKALLFFLFTFLVLVTAHEANATGLEGQPPNLNMQCLESKKVGVHTAQLSAKMSNQFPPPQSDVYIIECVSTDAGNKCTTGKDASDQFLFNNANDLTYLRSKYRYELKNFSGTQPLKSTLEGKIPTVTWESETHPTTGHTFFGVSILSEIDICNQYFPGQKLCSFPFLNSSEECSSLRWDPYGRVFDSKSLEPVKNAAVTLYEKTAGATSIVSLPGVTNPQYTADDGVFSFLVPDGTYTLTPSITSHTFPNVSAALHPNYVKAYTDIYRGEDIIQAGSIQHRDIPLDPVGAPFRAPIKIMDYSVILNKVFSKYQISGELSHPKSVVKVVSGTKYITEVTADNFGRFDITIDSTEIDPSLELKLEAVKTDLTLSTISFLQLIPAAYAQGATTSVKLPVILNNIEGYAYSSAGQPVGNATVTIYLISSQKPFTQTQADATGYFKIPSQYLPPLPYVIEIRATDGTSNILTATQFAIFNKNYTAEKKIDYGTYKPVPETPNLTPGAGTIMPTGNIVNMLTPGAGGSISALPSGVAIDSIVPPPADTTVVPSVSPALQTAKNMIFTLLLLLITGGGIAAAFYLYKKRQAVKAS